MENIILVHLHVWIVMTTCGMVTKMHDEGVSSYYKPFSLATRGAGDVHATIIHSPPPRDMFKKNIQRRVEGERGHYMKQNKKHTRRRCCCTKGTNRRNARNRQVVEGEPYMRRGTENAQPSYSSTAVCCGIDGARLTAG